MLSIHKLSLSRAEYYLELACEDYYLKGGEPPGQFAGKGAERLKIVGRVQDEVFRRLYHGFSPDGKVALVQNAGQTRGYHQRCPAFDLTFSDPKDVSVFWSQAPEEVRQRLEQLRRQVLRKVLAIVENMAGQTRRGPGGRIREQAGLLFAIFEHGTSRAAEPNGHFHVIAFNLSFREDGTTGAIRSNLLFEYKMALGALYRCELATAFQREFRLELERVNSWFQIKGASPVLRDVFSTRRKDIIEYCQQACRYDAIEAQIAAIATRPAKQHIARELLFPRWQEIGRQHGWSEKQVLELLATATAREKTPEEKAAALRSIVQEVRKLPKDLTKPKFVQAVAERAQIECISASEVLRAAQDAFKSYVPPVRPKKQAQTRGQNHPKAASQTPAEQQQEPEGLPDARGATDEISPKEIKRSEDKGAQLAQEQAGVAQGPRKEQEPEQEDPASRPRPKVHPEQEQSKTGDAAETRIPPALPGPEERERAQTETRDSDARRNEKRSSERDPVAELLAKDEIWRKAGFTVAEAKATQYPLVLLENKGKDIRLEIDQKALFPDAPAWNQLYRVKLPHLTLVLERHEYDRLKHVLDNRFFSVKSGYKFLFPASIKVSPFYGWKLPTLLVQPHDDPFKLKLRGAVFLDERSKVLAAETRKLVESIMAAGAKLFRDDSKRLPSTRLAEQGQDAAREDFDSRTKFFIGSDYKKAIESLFIAWKSDGVWRPTKNLIVTETHAMATVFNHLAQRQRLREGALGREFVEVNELEIHRKDRVLLTKGSKLHGIEAGDTGTVTMTTATRISIFLDRGKLVRLPIADYDSIELGYALTRQDARAHAPKRAFLFFEGLNPREELDNAHHFERIAKTRVYAPAPAAHRAFEEIKRQAQSREEAKTQHEQAAQKAHEAEEGYEQDYSY